MDRRIGQMGVVQLIQKRPGPAQTEIHPEAAEPLEVLLDPRL
jgi:hypothetical protein